MNYYAFENYLYHPENLAEILKEQFDKQSYIAEITRQKNRNILNIIGSIAVARQSYAEFKENAIEDDKDMDVFIERLKSDDFNSFYPFFNMKNYFERTSLSKYNLHTKDLVTTHWFKTQIEKILNS